ncbi:unnamed protein product [Adineta steineri]|uniref:Uncharacterized protein n=1 Tax=Adineta steineri TaxID=433720 RepID=A0A818GK13_9BILA|nr:unnamed protein product [Adineta steineri]
MSLSEPTFSFIDRKRYEAKCERERLRGSLPSGTYVSPPDDPWFPRPIDFTMVNFHPNRKKITRTLSVQDLAAKQPRQKFRDPFNPAVMKPFEVLHENHFTKSKHSLDDRDKFLLDPRLKYEKVKRMLNTEPYQMPKPHDFRQYPDMKDLDQSEFETKYDHDPGNIRFFTQHLNTLWLQERENERVPIIKNSVPEMYRNLTAKPKYDAKLILPKVTYPNKTVNFSRYRNSTRSVQSAYWERVEDHFNERQNKQRLEII